VAGRAGKRGSESGFAAVIKPPYEGACLEDDCALLILRLPHCARPRTEEHLHHNAPWPSSLNVSSRFSLSFSFFPLLRFLPPCMCVSLVHILLLLDPAASA